MPDSDPGDELKCEPNRSRELIKQRQVPVQPPGSNCLGLNLEEK